MTMLVDFDSRPHILSGPQHLYCQTAAGGLILKEELGDAVSVEGAEVAEKSQRHQGSIAGSVADIDCCHPFTIAPLPQLLFHVEYAGLSVPLLPAALSLWLCTLSSRNNHWLCRHPQAHPLEV